MPSTGVDAAQAASLRAHSVVVMLRFYGQETEADREAAVAKAALAAFPSTAPAGSDLKDRLMSWTGCPRGSAPRCAVGASDREGPHAKTQRRKARGVIGRGR